MNATLCQIQRILETQNDMMLKFTLQQLCLEVSKFKGTVPRDFSPLAFFFKQLLLVPVGKSRNDINFFRRFAEIFDFSGVKYTGEANNVITVGWFFRTLNGHYWEVISTDGFFLLIVPLKALANCQRSYWCITGVNDTGNACIAGVIDTGEVGNL